MKKELYWYEVFSRSAGNMQDLSLYQDSLLAFEQCLFPGQDFVDTFDYVTRGIQGSWSGAVLAFLGSIPVGVMTYEKTPLEEKSFSVGIAYVKKDDRRKGIWKKMSELVEADVRQMGAEKLKRYISIDRPYMEKSLLDSGYVAYDYPEFVKILK